MRLASSVKQSLSVSPAFVGPVFFVFAIGPKKKKKKHTVTRRNDSTDKGFGFDIGFSNHLYPRL
jgi:hypothetical protein